MLYLQTIAMVSLRVRPLRPPHRIPQTHGAVSSVLPPVGHCMAGHAEGEARGDVYSTSRVHVDSLQQLEQTGDTPSSLALPDYMNDSVVMITPPHTGFSRQQVREKNDLPPEVEERLLEAEQVQQEQAHIQTLETRNKELQVREKNDLSPEVEERLLEAEQVQQEQAHIQTLETRNKELQVREKNNLSPEVEERLQEAEQVQQEQAHIQTLETRNKELQVREKNDLSPEVEERLQEAEQVQQEQAHIQTLETRNKELQVQLAERNKQFRVLQEKFRMSNFHDEWHQKIDTTLEQLEKMQEQLGAPTPIVVETNEIEKQISEDEVLRTELEKHLSAIETLQATGADLISKSAGVDRGLSAKDMENKLCALHFMWRDIVCCFEQRHKGHEDAKRYVSLPKLAADLNVLKYWCLRSLH
ncbi:DST [Branchiostoma lanceolatum]|uniref:DST protein n=1 Tax=Branchiostoma lanceolatum TaxID=7740 RepID=A0A8J9YR51_BRALA|nr:DST [Branchiostoma lanceolatum]